MGIDGAQVVLRIGPELPSRGGFRRAQVRYRKRAWRSRLAEPTPVSVNPCAKGTCAYLKRRSPRPSIGAWHFPSPQGTRREEDNFSADWRGANGRAGLAWTCLDSRRTSDSHLA